MDFNIARNFQMLHHSLANKPGESKSHFFWGFLMVPFVSTTSPRTSWNAGNWPIGPFNLDPWKVTLVGKLMPREDDDVRKVMSQVFQRDAGTAIKRFLWWKHAKTYVDDRLITCAMGKLCFGSLWFKFVFAMNVGHMLFLVAQGKHRVCVLRT